MTFCDFVLSALLKATYLVPYPADLGLSGPHHSSMWHGQILPGLDLRSVPRLGKRGTGALVADPCLKLSSLPIKRGPMLSTGREGQCVTSPPRQLAPSSGSRSDFTCWC